MRDWNFNIRRRDETFQLSSHCAARVAGSLAQKLTITAFETEDHILLAGATDDGLPLEAEQCRRLLSLPANVKPISPNGEPEPTDLKELLSGSRTAIFTELEQKNASYFEGELDKLDRWGEDQRSSLKLTLKELDEQIKDTNKAARLAANLPEKLKLQRRKRQLESDRDAAWQEYDKAAKGIEQRKDGLMDEVEQRLKQQINEQQLFRITWRVK